jgi:hypothetical protein
LPYQDDASDETLGYLIPIHATLLSVIAGYLGIFSVLVLPAPIALIMGIVALRDIKKRQSRGEKIGGKGRAIFAIAAGGLITLIYVATILIILIVGITH